MTIHLESLRTFSKLFLYSEISVLSYFNDHIENWLNYFFKSRSTSSRNRCHLQRYITDCRLTKSYSRYSSSLILILISFLHHCLYIFPINGNLFHRLARFGTSRKVNKVCSRNFHSNFPSQHKYQTIHIIPKHCHGDLYHIFWKGDCVYN